MADNNKILITQEAMKNFITTAYTTGANPGVNTNYILQSLNMILNDGTTAAQAVKDNVFATAADIHL